MIERIWYGWTEPEDADAYEELLEEEIVPGFEEESEMVSFHVGRRDLGDEVEFVTVMRFESLADVKSLAGEQYEEAHIPEPARDVLARWDETAQHYEVTDLA